jgi:hypothetical protein
MKAGERESTILLGDPLGSDLVPLGDPPGSKGWARIQSEKEARNDPRRASEKYVRPPSEEEIVFDPNYEPLLFSDREIRRRLLAPWRMISPACLKEFVDPYVARELRRQETRDKELRDLLDALLGKASDWRTALCIESQRNIDARVELGRIQDNSWTEGDTDELGRFLEALKAVKRLNKRDRSDPPRH